jgi:hypothetical protein
MIDACRHVNIMRWRELWRLIFKMVISVELRKYCMLMPNKCMFKMSFFTFFMTIYVGSSFGESCCSAWVTNTLYWERRSVTSQPMIWVVWLTVFLCAGYLSFLTGDRRLVSVWFTSTQPRATTLVSFDRCTTCAPETIGAAAHAGCKHDSIKSRLIK